MTKLWKKIILCCLLIVWAGGTYYGYRQTAGSDNQLEKITIGYQKGDLIDISKSRGLLVKKMKKLGYKVVFKEFSDGSSEMQALISGSINYARTGDTPPITAKSNIAYLAASAKKASGSGILISSNATIKKLSDLKGKKVAYTQGTSSHYLLLKALEKANLSTSDIKLVNMKQPDAAIAFSKGKIDAWVTWDPYTAQGQVQQHAKLLVTGKGLSNNRDFIISTQKYAKKHHKVNQYLVKYVSEDMKWANNHHKSLVKLLTKKLNMKKSVIQKMVNRRDWTISPLSKSVIADEQKIADTFYNNQLIKKRINVSDGVIKIE